MSFGLSGSHRSKMLSSPDAWGGRRDRGGAGGQGAKVQCGDNFVASLSSPDAWDSREGGGGAKYTTEL